MLNMDFAWVMNHESVFFKVAVRIMLLFPKIYQLIQAILYVTLTSITVKSLI